MCGRFILFTPAPKIATRFRVKRVDPTLPGPSYNIAPSRDIAIVNTEGQRQLITAKWGLVPSWAKDTSVGTRMINARAETITEKPSFRHAIEKQRCLVITNGFFLWKMEGKRKLPMFVRVSSGKVFAFAGLYNLWTSPEGETLHTCTIITTSANDLIKPFQDRMPVILLKSDENTWLDPSFRDMEAILPLLTAFDADSMEVWEVTAKMNRPDYDDPENIKPIVCD
jgi:putative SOS response-associated peptidase YedK